MKPTLKLCLLATILTLSSTISEAENGFYPGAGLGYSAGDSTDGVGDVGHENLIAERS